MIRNREQEKNNFVHYTVESDGKLLEWLLENVKGESRSKIKATLKGRGIKVDKKTVTQFY